MNPKFKKLLLGAGLVMAYTSSVQAVAGNEETYKEVNLEDILDVNEADLNEESPDGIWDSGCSNNSSCT